MTAATPPVSLLAGDVTLAETLDLAPLLDRAAQARLVRGCLKLRQPAPDLVLPPADRLKVLVWEWLAHLGFVEDATRNTLIALMTPALEGYIARAPEWVADDPADELPSFFLMIVDHRWATWSSLFGPTQAAGSELFDLLYNVPATQEDRRRDGPGVTYFTLQLQHRIARAERALASRRLRHGGEHGRPGGADRPAADG